MLLAVKAVRKEFGTDVILDSVDLRIDRGEKVALVGRNGCGKTTLLKILTGEQDATSGSVQWAQGAKVGYLSQVSNLDQKKTVLELAQEARKRLVEMERRLEELRGKLEGEPSPDDLDEFAALSEHFYAEGGYSLENDLSVVLSQMGFDESEFGKPASALSGGERTRLGLARLLLEEPDLIILDEPTNHLDIQATEWLERWIRAYHGAVLLVSHDREFLIATANRVVELSGGFAKSYPGDFLQYVHLREEEMAQQIKLAERQAGEIAKLDEYVRRFMNSQRTAQARGRLKQMEKLKSVAVQAPRGEKSMQGGFKVKQRTGDIVIATKRLTQRFGDETLLHGLDWQVRWGERWGVIGSNGGGKSTLIKLILGLQEPAEGEAKLGSNVHVGYFSQDADTLPQGTSAMSYLHHSVGMELGAARNLLGRFLISGDDAARPLSTLSGGERNKVQLAALTAQHPNTLILDEPTNHLDMDSREALADILREYNGTLILVSHDRWLLDQVTDHTLDVRAQGTSQFAGSVTEYRRSTVRDITVSTPAKAPSSPSATTAAPTLSPRELSKEIARLTKSVSAMEDEIARVETAIADLESAMARETDGAVIVEQSQRHAALQKELEQHMASWEEQGLELERMRAAQGTT